MNFSVKPLGDNAVLVSFKQGIHPDILQEVLTVEKFITSKALPGILETVPAYASVAIFYDPLLLTFEEIQNMLLTLPEGKKKNQLSIGKHWKIPVCYSHPYAPDLKAYLKKKGMEEADFIRLHTSTDYLVYMRGFIPGFVYLGGLNPKLQHPRKDKPALTVPAGSVAIGGNQTGIYGISAPAGWHIIGRTPSKIFDPANSEVMKIKPGDTVRFTSISVEAFELSDDD